MFYLKHLLILSVLLPTPLFAADIYVKAKIDNLSTDYAASKAAVVIQIKDADYAGCNGRHVKFYRSDFEAQSIDVADAAERANFVRSMALAAMMSDRRVEFILKEESGGTCTAKGWLKVLGS